MSQSPAQPAIAACCHGRAAGSRGAGLWRRAKRPERGLGAEPWTRSPGRYEEKALVVTTNLPFKQWDTIFPNASCAVGLVDRLTHHASIVKITGDSYRLREAERAQKGRRAS